MAANVLPRSTTCRISIDLPVELLERAAARGADLEKVIPRAIEKWFDTVDSFSAMLDALHSVEPPMTQAEIDEEFAVWKAEKAVARASADRQ